MANVLSAEFSRFLGDLHNRLSPNDKMELIAALDDISGGTPEDPIHSTGDARVADKPRNAIGQLLQDYAA